MAREPILFVQDLTIRYDTAIAVDALCLEIQRGEVFGLLGPNGSGKSSTLAAISGDLKPAAGIVRVGGLSIDADPLAYRRLLGLVPQDLALYDDMTGAENLLFFGQLYGLGGRALRQRVAEVLEMVRLTDVARRLVRTWSGGMQRRLNLACALLHQPDLLLLDEPTVGLDLQSRDAVVETLLAVRARGCAVVLTTHQLEEVELVCDRIGIMNAGCILALGTLAELATLVEPEDARLAQQPACENGRESFGSLYGVPFRTGKPDLAMHHEAPPPRRALELLFRQLTARSRAAA